MTPEFVCDRLLAPTVILTMVAAGIAYGFLLWAIDLRPGIRLFVAGVLPGLLFLGVILAIRGLQGTLFSVYLALMANWAVFAGTGILAVVVWRRWRSRGMHP